MFRHCRNRFRCFSQMKITKLELFQNALKIILVGTGNVLSPHKYFQFIRTLKYVVVNSDGRFLDFMESIFLGSFWNIPKELLEGMGGHDNTWGGPPPMCGRPHGEALHGPPSCPIFSLLGPWEGLQVSGGSGFLQNYPTPWDFL